MTTQQNTILIQFFVYFVSKKMSFLFAKGFSDVEARRMHKDQSLMQNMKKPYPTRLKFNNCIFSGKYYVGSNFLKIETYFLQLSSKDQKLNRQRDRKIERQKYRQTERQRDRETERQKDRKTERQKDRVCIF